MHARRGQKEESSFPRGTKNRRYGHKFWQESWSLFAGRGLRDDFKSLIVCSERAHFPLFVLRTASGKSLINTSSPPELFQASDTVLLINIAARRFLKPCNYRLGSKGLTFAPNYRLLFALILDKHHVSMGLFLAAHP
jgi:hypothetical protein